MSTQMPELDWKHEPLADSFRAFKARITLYLEDKEVTDPTKQATKVKIATGDEGTRCILASGLSREQQKDPMQANLATAIEEQHDTTVHINYRVHHLELSHMRQKPTETITDVHYMSWL